ncbi:MAG: hypothetical protein M2R46_01791 [Verrucomicrobia subdivision 3 bacterium]|nr:hypothetical protein [Limisphaerales bacterium]
MLHGVFGHRNFRNESCGRIAPAERANGIGRASTMCHCFIQSPVCISITLFKNKSFTISHSLANRLMNKGAILQMFKIYGTI